MRRLPLAAALLFASLLWCGCGRQDASVYLARRGPVLSNVVVNPSTFDFRGGTATVSVAVQSERAVRSVMAQITPMDVPNPTNRYYPLTANAAGLYQVAIPFPSNPLFGGQAQRYRVLVSAQDSDLSDSNSIEVLVQVQAADPSVPITPQ